MNTIFKPNAAPLLIVLGQSNAHGHGTQLIDSEKVLTPYPNVLGLSTVHNQSLEIDHLTWSPFVTHGMNLGEIQDHTCCLISEFARTWQSAIEDGSHLPDLYVIQISIGGQGIDMEERSGQNMWAASRPPILQLGPLGEVDISLYPLAMHILKLAIESLHHCGKEPVILGVHWNQWETEVESGSPVIERAKEHYTRLIEDLFSILSPCPFYFYKPISRIYENEPGRIYMSQLFEWFEEHWPTVHVLDIQQSSLWNPEKNDFGIFQEDLVHYTDAAQKWFAAWQYQRLFFDDTSNEKILVLGDSITDDGTYITYLNCYMHQHPLAAPVTFVSLGVSSENVTGLTEPCHPFPRPCIHNRLDNILREFDCKQVLVCYGMNDGIYYPLSEERLLEYQQQMELLVHKLKTAGKTVIVMTPPPFDAASFDGPLHDKTDREFGYLTPYSGYDEVLLEYGALLFRTLSDKADKVIDLHAPLHAYSQRKYKENPHYISGDGIHPNPSGHLVMAAAILRQLYDIPSPNLEMELRSYDETIFPLIQERDLLLHRYYKETIGHDNPEKYPVPTKKELYKKLREYEAYLNS